MSELEERIDPALFATLEEATRRYRLTDPNMTNAQIAERLELAHALGDHAGVSNCCFWSAGVPPRLVAIRITRDEIAIFHMWQSCQMKMEEIGFRIS